MFIYYNSSCYTYTCATRFDMYLGHPQSCQYKNLTKKDKNLSGPFVYSCYFIYHKIQNTKLEDLNNFKNLYIKMILYLDPRLFQ